MKDWELIFGDSLPHAVHHIVERAIKPYAFLSARPARVRIQTAHDELAGIATLMTFMGMGPDATIRLMNEQHRLQRLLDTCTDEQLEAFVSEVTTEAGQAD